MSIKVMKMAHKALNFEVSLDEKLITLAALRQAIEKARKQENPSDIVDRAYFAGKQDGIAEVKTILKLKRRYK